MPVYLSASSRLHALLTALAGVESSRALRDGWAEVLGIPKAEVPFDRFGLPSVANLVSGAGDEARRAEELVGLPLQEQRMHEWSNPVYAPGANLDGPIHQQAVSPEAMTYLHSVASVLHKGENHETLPDPDKLTDLVAQVNALFDSVEASTELADDVKRALLRSIAQVRLAVENARIGGSEGVHEAVELLLGATVVRGNAVPRRTINKVVAIVGVAFTLFSAGPTIQASLEAWPQVYETLTAGSGGTHDTDPADAQGRHAGKAEHEP